jgi:hypothetical protein
MLKCPRCGHQNLPNYESCSACGTALAAGAGGGGGGAAPVGGGDEYARLMASRAAAQARTRKIGAVVAVVALGLGGFVWYRDYQQKKVRQEKLDFFERWAELEKRETGSFFNCAMASEIDMNLVQNASQIQMKIEGAYATQQKTFSDYLLTDCVPKIERARQAFGALKDTPAEYGPALDKYRDVLPKLQAGIEEYAEKIKNRKEVKDTDQLIQEHGGAWHSSTAPSPEGIAYEKFMHCAVPGLAKMKDAQEMLEFLADTCFKKDPVAFMDRARKECGPILTNVDPKAKPSGTWALSMKRFYEEEARQLRAWEDCGRKSRKGKKAEDLATFLLAVGDYMQARTDVVKTARAIKDEAR